MELEPEDLAKIDKLSLSNIVTLSALVTVLVRNGVIQEADLSEEIRRLHEKLVAAAGSQ